MTENEKRLLENRLSAEVGQPVMVVGSTAGLGEMELVRLTEAASAKGAVVVVMAPPEPAPQERLKMMIKAMPELTVPAFYHPPKEWWRGGNPRRFRNA
jgi:hypothetical protein